MLRVCMGGAMLSGAAACVYGIMSSEKDYPPHGLAPTVNHLPDWLKSGCGDKEYICEEKGATFSRENPPKDMPDLSNHGNHMAETLRNNPGMYEKLMKHKTSLGVGLGHCIKTGIDNPGHPHIKTVGMVAGDEESYDLFKDLFDPVISARHGGYAPDAIHPTDTDCSKLNKTKLDPTGKYVLTSRVRTGRSIKGTRLPPVCTFEERREIESSVVAGLLNLEGDLKGDYYPLNGSRSYAPKPEGMSHEKEESLRSCGNLFQEPDSTLLLSSGCGRHWPDARGIYHNEAENCFVWVNEEDQLRIVSMEKGDDIQGVFTRLIKLIDGVGEVLKREGKEFMHNEHLGYILTCPSNLGTGLRAGSLVKIPLVSARGDFKKMLGTMGLQARGQGGVDADAKGGIFDISNADRLGKSEIVLVNIMIDGVSKLVQWEQMLEKGESIEHLVPKVN